MSQVELYFHLVWTTKNRQPMLNSHKEEAMFRCALGLIRELGYEVLAINGMPDHVHLLLRSGARIDLSELMKKVKGTTSALLNDMTDHMESFRWQEGYYAVTVTPSHVPKVLSYVRRQKEHHRDGTTHAAWEEAGPSSENASDTRG